MSWEAIFQDQHFEPANFVLPLGPVQQNANNNINLAPLQFVTDVEPIGHAYHKLVFPDNSEYTVPALQEDEIDPQELMDAVREADLEDYYALLFVSDKGLKVTDADIQKTWKLINLYLHPDKAESARKQQAEILFKACHKAYETLTDPKLKIDYDSSVPFDESIPEEKATYKTLTQFIQAFAPVFERNERWSKTQPCPKIGDASSTEDEVNKFYKFWLGFQSWREFPEGDTEKVGDSAGRQQRRDAENKNAKARALLKQKENTRLRALAERAQAADPRVKFYKTAKLEQEKCAKQAQFEAKQELSKTKMPKAELEKLIKQRSDEAVAAVVERQRQDLIKLLSGQ